MKLKGKSIVVTGASSGMGRVIVEEYVKEGANVIAVARRLEKLEELAGSLKDAEGTIIPFQGDVSNKQDCEAMIDKAVEKFGRLDVLVNNAGVMDNMAAVANFSDEKLDQLININVAGPLYAMRKAVQVFLAQGDGGNIITTSSVGSKHQVSGVIYGASKAAINSIVRHTAFVYRNEKIRCNAIAPGGINTDISASMGQVDMDGTGRIQQVHQMMTGMGEGIDIANLAVFLASDESAFISGQIIAVDGGWTSF